MVLPRELCSIAPEDLDDLALGMNGQTAKPRSKPGRAEATLIYAKDGTGWDLTDAFLTHIESVK
jgi:hypothetical protein